MASSKGAFLLLCLLVSGGASAGDWKFTSGITLSERYTDNVDLAAGGAEQSEWITEVRPHFTLRRKGARMTADVDYSLQGLLYAQGTRDGALKHYLNGRANAELLEDWFFLDASARISQELVSLGGGVGVGDPVGLGNTTSVGAYSLSPYLKHRFGSIATVEARIAHDGVFIGDSGTTDTNTTRYSLSAVSGSASHPLSWNVQYRKTDNNNSSATVADTSSEQLSASARYQLSRTFGLLAQAGKEKNDYAGVKTTIRDYSYYGLGAFYTPSRRFSMDLVFNTSDNGDFVSGQITARPTLRTTIEASAGQRAYGRSYSLGVAHRTRHSNWSLRYRDDLTTYQQQFLNYVGTVYVYQCPGGVEYQLPGVAPSDPVNCTFVQVLNLFSPALNNETYLSKNLTGMVSYTQRRNTWTLSLYDNRREFQTSGATDETLGLQASWSLRQASNVTFTLTGGMSRNEESTVGRSDDLWNLGLVVARQFSPKMTGSVEVRHQERDSNQVGDDYSENSVAARLNMTF